MVCRLMRSRSRRMAWPLPKIDVGRGQVLQALVGAAVVVVLDEGPDLRLEVAGQVVVLEQDAVLQRPVPALDLALGLRVAGRAAECSVPSPASQSARSPEM